VEIPFADYREFAVEAREYTEYNPGELNLLVNFELNVKAQTGNETIEERFNPGMVIPMKESTFVVEGKLTDSNSGEITETQIVSLPQVKQARTNFTVSTAVSGGFLVAFFLLTVPVKQKARPQKQVVSSIFKKHQERIVVTSSDVSSLLENAIAVTSFEELLKLADEVGRPVLYSRSRAEVSKEHYFLVVTREHVYCYEVGDRE